MTRVQTPKGIADISPKGVEQRVVHFDPPSGGSQTGIQPTLRNAGPWDHNQFFSLTE